MLKNSCFFCAGVGRFIRLHPFFSTDLHGQVLEKALKDQNSAVKNVGLLRLFSLDFPRLKARVREAHGATVG